MKILYAPWREDYTTSTAPGPQGQEGISEKECVFCTQLHLDNEQVFILKRCKSSYIMLNRYPYNAGHLLILPFSHTAHLEDLPLESRNELIHLATESTIILKKELKAQGVNIGLNLGKAAGAGIPAHLHMHILPRWQGDTNFLPTLAETKQVSTDLSKLYKTLRPFFEKI